MSPRQTRRGNVRHSVRIRAKEKETSSQEEEQSPKKELSARKSHGKKIKKAESSKHERSLTVEEAEEIKPKMKKTKTKKSRKKAAANDEDDFKNNTSTDTVAQVPKLKNSKRGAINGTMSNNLSPTFTPVRLSSKSVDSNRTPVSKITPKINPIVVNLTPLRKSKTPKKSPINSSSPKTHSETPFKWCKTPRKLSITDDSPESSNKSSTFGNNSTNAASVAKVLSDSSMNTSVSQVSSKAKKKEKLKSSKAVLPVRKFSASPKIVIRSSRSKSRKSKSSKMSSSAKKAKSHAKSDLDMLKNMSLLQMSAMLSRPRVVLEKLKINDNSALKNGGLSTDDEAIETPVVKILIHKMESPRRLKSSLKKRLTDSETPLRPRTSPRSFDENETLNSRELTSTENAKTSAPNVSSTPLDKMRRPVNLNVSFDLDESPDVFSSPNSSKYKHEVSPKTRKTSSNKSPRISDVSEPLMEMSDMSLADDANKNNTYDLANNGSNVEDKDDNTGNETYEVLEPKTPILQRKLRKRSSSVTNLSSDHEAAKKVCKVRFAGSVKQLNDNFKKSASQSPKSSAKSVISNKKVSTRKEVKFNKRLSTSRTMFRRSNSMQNSASSAIRNEQRSLSRAKEKLADAKKQETPGNKSLNRSIRTISSEIKASKTPVARKVPNFAQIHQKKFADMESVVDAKNRLEKRHLTLTLSKLRPKAVLESKSQALPTESANGVYNRFGYRLEKDDLKKMVLKKQSTVAKKNRQEETRTFLKGVRMNRRFQLQMKSRNLNP